MTKTEAGSYAFGTFKENTKELERLQEQARIAFEFEKGLLLEAGLRPGLTVLDLACGPGSMSLALAGLVGPGGQVTGVDISPEFIALANRLKEEKGVRNLFFAEGSVYELALPEAKYDFVHSRLLFQHLENPVRAMQSILRVMKPGGTLYILDVDDDWITIHPASAAFDSFKERAMRGQASRGGDRLVGRKLLGYLRTAGYEAIEVKIKPVTTQAFPLRQFLDITTAFKMEQILEPEREAAARERDEFYGVCDHPLAWGAIGVFVATGRRPGAAKE